MISLDQFREERVERFRDDLCMALARLLADKGEPYRFKCLNEADGETVRQLMRYADDWASALNVQGLPARADAARRLDAARHDDHFVRMLDRVVAPNRRQKAGR